MTGDTVKKTTVRKRPKRVRSAAEFDAFTRRILRAYAARVADGDIEALRSMASLTQEVDAVVTLAVLGLRRFHYSWEAIGDALGTSRQAAQQRYGDRTERHTLDARLVKAGLGVTVVQLAVLYVDHHPGTSDICETCPGCGFRYTERATECPTMATVRPLLRKRCREQKEDVIDRLSPDQFAELQGKPTPRTTRVETATRPARPAASPAHTAPTLFPANGKD